MKLQLLLLTLGSSIFHSAYAVVCPDSFCASEVVNTAIVVDPSQECPGLTWETLDTFTYNNNGADDVLVELRGPSDMSYAADLVITAPHGGDMKPTYIPDRETSETSDYCPTGGCKTSKDSYTKEISELVQEKYITNYCKVPFLVINHLHRSKLDANREVNEAAQEDPIAVDAWQAFHTQINNAQIQLSNYFGTTTETTTAGNVSTRTGVKALLFDMHGYAGYDWETTNGSPLIQWGYRFSDESLDPNQYCPLDTRSTGTIGTMTHGRWINNDQDTGYECLVRGPRSLGARVTELIGSGLVSSDAMCGHGTPSQEFPSPKALANDINYCETFNTDGECHYFSGGYDVERHERMDWVNLSGDHFNAVQAELPRCIRWAESSVRDEVHADFADKLSIAIMSFCRDLYGNLPQTTTTSTSTTSTSTSTSTQVTTTTTPVSTTVTETSTTQASTTTTFVATPEPTGSGICSNDESRSCSVDGDCECSPPFRRVLRGTDMKNQKNRVLKKPVKSTPPPDTTTTAATTTTTPPACGCILPETLSPTPAPVEGCILAAAGEACSQDSDCCSGDCNTGKGKCKA